MNEYQLTPITFHILFAIYQRELHGYEIIKQVSEDSQNRLQLLTGTLYNSLKRLLEEKLIEETASDERRRYYRATKAGKQQVDAELERYTFVTKLAKNYGGKNV